MANNKRQKRAKNEMTKGDKLAQRYRNLAAMRRVYEAAVLSKVGARSEVAQAVYWKPWDMRTLWDRDKL